MNYRVDGLISDPIRAFHLTPKHRVEKSACQISAKRLELETGEKLSIKSTSEYVIWLVVKTRKPTNLWGSAKRDVAHPTVTIVYNTCYH